jgi:small GTP-binding protein
MENRFSSKNEKVDYLAKVLLIGDSSVGKTSMTMRFTNNIFSQSFITTIGIDFVSKIIECNSSKIKLQIWDTAGQERFRAITTAYYRGADIIIIVYDVCDTSSFENVKNWIISIKNYTKDLSGIILVGNKADMVSYRQVPYEDGLNLAKQYKIPFFECSAKKGTCINEIFDEAGKIHMKNFDKLPNEAVYYSKTTGKPIKMKPSESKKSFC